MQYNGEKVSVEYILWLKHSAYVTYFIPIHIIIIFLSSHSQKVYITQKNIFRILPLKLLILCKFVHFHISDSWPRVQGVVRLLWVRSQDLSGPADPTGPLPQVWQGRGWSKALPPTCVSPLSSAFPGLSVWARGVCTWKAYMWLFLCSVEV